MWIRENLSFSAVTLWLISGLAAVGCDHGGISARDSGVDLPSDRSPPDSGPDSSGNRVPTDSGLDGSVDSLPLNSGLDVSSDRSLPDMGLDLFGDRSPLDSSIDVSGNRLPPDSGLDAPSDRSPPDSGLDGSSDRSPPDSGLDLTNDRSPLDSGLDDSGGRPPSASGVDRSKLLDELSTDEVRQICSWTTTVIAPGEHPCPGASTLTTYTANECVASYRTSPSIHCPVSLVEDCFSSTGGDACKILLTDQCKAYIACATGG